MSSEVLERTPSFDKERISPPEGVEDSPRWFREVEEHLDQLYQEGGPINSEAGEAWARIFREAGVDIGKEEFRFVCAKKRTEGPVMEAIEENLERVLGVSKGEIEEFVREEIQPLRKKKGGEGKEEKANRFLVMAVENVLMDIVTLIRQFQREGREDLKEGALENLRLSLEIRLRKGKARKEGHCTKEEHQEHIWWCRGSRDLPPGSLERIGEFLSKVLQEKGKREIPVN